MLSTAELADLKERQPCDVVAARWVKLRRKGKKMIGPCPVCGGGKGTARFEATPDGWVRAVCADGGDVIRLVQKAENLDFREAVKWLGGPAVIDPEKAPADEAVRSAKEAKRDADSAKFREGERSTVYDVWKRAKRNAPGVSEYLKIRGLDMPPGAPLRLVASMPFYEYAAKDAPVLHRGPAMAAPIVRADGKFAGIHLTWLDPARPKGKAIIVEPETGNILRPGKSRGSTRGNVIRLAMPETVTRIIMGEGIETTLSMRQALVLAGRDLSTTAFWAGVDLGNIGGKAAATIAHPTKKDKGGRPQRVPGPDADMSSPAIVIPDSVTEVVLLGDGDSDPVLTSCALYRGATRFAREGRQVLVAWAIPGDDFNDMIRAGRAADVVARYDAAGVPSRPRIEAPKARDKSPAGGSVEAPAGESAPDADVAAPDFRPEALSSSAGGDGGAPDKSDFDIDDMNREYALVLMGGKPVIYREVPEADDNHRFLTPEAFAFYFANKFVERRGPDGRKRPVTYARAWKEHPRRRTFDGVEFYPGAPGETGRKGYLNLWKGFAVEAAGDPDPRRYAIFRDHLLNNVANGDERLFAWVFGFFAHIVQRPRERIGVALVLRGGRGSGKSMVGEVFGKLLGPHFRPVDDPRYVTGNFNTHLASCLLLQADEAVWAGDKVAEGRIKGLITSSVQQIEAKGVDPIQMRNFVRVLMTSNERWVVPAGEDERRFAVLDVNPRCRGNIVYFRELLEEIGGGGLAHLLGDLMRFDFNAVNLWQIPSTAALLEQKINSLDSVRSWWFGRLMAGEMTHGTKKEWGEPIKCSELFDDYVVASEKIGIRRKRDETIFGQQIRELVPCRDGRVGVKRERRPFPVEGQNMPERKWCYVMPPLSEAREAFDEFVGQQNEWGDD